MAVRDACDAGELDPAEAAEEASRLGAAVDRLLAGQTCYAPNRKLLAHLGRERDALFTFLVIPEVQAANWRAEHAIRPAVVSRKPWGGNATWKGATVQMAAHRQRHAHHGVARLAVRQIDGEVRWRAE